MEYKSARRFTVYRLFNKARTEYGDWKSVHHGTDYLGIIGKFETQSEKAFKWKFCGNIESDPVAARLHKVMEKKVH